MSKIINKSMAADITRFCKSAFTVSFCVEILGVDVWHDCNEGWVDIGPCCQGIKIHYNLYPGQSYEIDILIWPHVAKIWHGSNYGWVRTWLFLERRFFAFSIRHMFPVRVRDLQCFTLSVTPTIGISNLGPTAKNDKNVEVYLSPLSFGELRYFAPVIDRQETFNEFVQQLIWNLIVNYIPSTIFDDLFDKPQIVTDIRHQDALIYNLKEYILNRVEVGFETQEPEERKIKARRESKTLKDKQKKKPIEMPKLKYETKLLGDSLLAGVGRVLSFETFGNSPPDLGGFMAVVSSNNLPAEDDSPVIFVNVNILFDAPMDEFQKLRISHLYTRWSIGDEEHDSEHRVLKTGAEFKIGDHHAVPVEPKFVAAVTATFLENPFEIQLRGIRTKSNRPELQLFGSQKFDQHFGVTPLKVKHEITDFLIAVTRIDAKCLAKGMNKIINGEFPLYPPRVEFESLERDEICTNDINLTNALNQHLVVPPHIVIKAQMSLGVSMGIVGCQPKQLLKSYARLFCSIREMDSATKIVTHVSEINKTIMQSATTEDILTGFALDAGRIVILYVEGPSEGHILSIYQLTLDLYPKIKSIYSSSMLYPSRIYSEVFPGVPFGVLKMHVPLSIILSCPAVYAAPALPLPTRSAVLKFGRLIARNSRDVPNRNELPTASELKSFNLELCVATSQEHTT